MLTRHLKGDANPNMMTAQAASGMNMKIKHTASKHHTRHEYISSSKWYKHEEQKNFASQYDLSHRMAPTAS